MAKQLNIGLIGYKFMGKAHSSAFRQVKHFFPDLGVEPVLKVICGRDEAGVKAAAEQFGWDGYETSWQKVVRRKDIDVIDVATPSDMHHIIAIAAAKAGKHIICEKPLALTRKNGQAMVDAVTKAGVKNIVSFNYRRVPAIAHAQKMISEGRLGTIYHFRATYLQDWIVDPAFPLVWRLQKPIAGQGTLGDLGAHIADLARYLVGEVTDVVGYTETFIKKRPKLAGTMGGLTAAGSQEMGDVTVDDAAAWIATFQNGAMGTFEVTRFGTGNKNGEHIEINGSEGSLRFNLERLNELEYFNRNDPPDVQGWRDVLITEGVHRYANAWWPSGHIIGWEHSFTHQFADFFKAIVDDTPVAPSFADGLKVNEILDAVERSAATKKWQHVG
jgi:predicted dehydrogenase